MAKKDAIFNYSSAFDTSSYIDGITTDWNNNKSNAFNDRFDVMWSGDPSASPGTALSGWDVGNIKGLSLHEVELAPYAKDFEAATWSHKLIYDIKRAFNLPNQEDMSTWKDEYTCAAGEHHLLVHTSKDMASWPMTLGAQDGFSLDGTNQTRCTLEVGIFGFDQHGAGASDMQYTVRPTATNVSTYNAHYQTLKDNNTAAADYTSPTQVGSQFTQIGNILLLNFENQWQPTDMENNTRDQLKLTISWSSHSYAQIKTLIDTAIA